jgi:hypothetical protein
MITRPVNTTESKQRASAHIRQLAAKVKQTFPDMGVHQHLTDAARETDAGRHDNAKHHLDAAIGAFAPLQLIRHGIHDDEGHRAAKAYMQEAHRGRLLVADAEHIANANLELHERQIAQAQQAAQDQAAKREAKAAAGPPDTGRDVAGTPAAKFVPQAQPKLAPPASTQPATRPPARPQPAGKEMSWDGVLDAIELAAKPKLGSGERFKKLSGTLAKRGVKDPAALAAWIGRRKYGAKKFGRLSHGHAHANGAGGIELGYSPAEKRGPGGEWIGSAMSSVRRGIVAHQASDPVSREMHLRAAQGTLSGQDSELARNVAATLRRARVARQGGDSVQADMLMTRAHRMLAAAKSGTSNAMANAPASVIELFNPGQPRDGEGKWVKAGFGSQHGEFGSRFTPGSKDHARAIWELGDEAGSRPDNRSTTMRDALHNLARAMTRRDMRAAHAHLAEAKIANRRDTGGNYTYDLRAIEDQLSRVPKGVGEWMPQPSPLSRAGQHPGVYVDRTGGPVFNPTAGAMLQLTEMSNGWEAVLHAIELSADTGRLASEPHPFGKPSGPGLWGVQGMELPPYIQNIARALLRKGRAKNLSQAIAMAKGATARWQHGKNTRPEVRAASAATNASWAAKQARAHAHSADGWAAMIELVGTAAGAAKDQRIAAGSAGGGQFGSGGVAAAGGQQKAAQSRAQQKAALLAKARQERASAKLLAIRIAADRAALASASGKKNKGQKGAKTTARASKTASGTPAAKGAARAKAAASPLSAASTGLSPAATARAAAVAKAAAGKMNKAQLTSAIKALTTQEKNLLAAAATAVSQAAKL